MRNIVYDHSGHAGVPKVSIFETIGLIFRGSGLSSRVKETSFPTPPVAVQGAPPCVPWLDFLWLQRKNWRCLTSTHLVSAWFLKISIIVLA